MNIKTKEASSLLVAVLAAAIVALATALAHVAWWVVLCVAVGTFLIVALFALFVIRKYVAYKLKPIYSIVFSRNVHTHEILDELKDKHVESISEELSAWAETSDMEIARLKETEKFRKEYLGNVAHELKTPIFNIQGYISTLLDGGLEDERLNRKNLERTEKSIDRLMVNLLTNSICYGREGGQTRVRFRDMLDKILIEVEDSGVGIAKEDIPRVFERFYRTDKGRSREHGGTGLGLAIVKHIVEAHGEHITLRSEVGVGSTFSFTLKKADPNEIK